MREGSKTGNVKEPRISPMRCQNAMLRARIPAKGAAVTIALCKRSFHFVMLLVIDNGRSAR